jgi:hypothetical protein
MDMNSRMAMAEKLSVQQLQQAIQSGSLPAYIGIPLIEQKNKEKSQMAAAQQGQEKPPSVASQILQQAEQGGVDQLPSNLPVQGMADGGIVAFAEGGDADDFDVEAYREQEAEDEYANSLSALVAAAQAAAEEGVSTRKKGKKYADGGIVGYNQGGLTDLQKQILAYRTDQAYRDFSQSGESDVSFNRFYGTGEGQLGNPLPSSLRTKEFVGNPDDERTVETSPAGDFVKDLYGQTKTFAGTVLDKVTPVLKDRFSSKYQDRANEVRRLGVEGGPFSIGLTDYEREQAQKKTTEGIKNLSKPRTDLLTSVLNPPTLATIPVTPQTASPEPIPKNTEDMDITRDTGISGGALPNAGIANLTAANTVNPAVPGAPQGSRSTTPAALVNQLAEQTNRPRSAYDDFLDEIRAGREDLKTQAQKDKYMAIISAGLGMMSGTSPNAFANIGQGAQAGVASYMASGKQRAAEKAALNKNLLMGRRYQSMEDVANRTADINERRIAAIAAARGSGGDSKSEAQLDRQENAFTTRLRNAQATVLSALQAKFGKDGALIDPKGYAKAEQELTQKYVAPVMTMQERFLAKRYPDVFGDQAEMPDSGSVSTRLKVDKNGNIIQ